MPRKRRPFFRRKRYIEGEDSPRPPRRPLPLKKGIFILPSLLTTFSIFFAFYGIISAIKQEFVLSAALILVAGFFDGIDGKVARLTNTSSKFGLELDSLADVISFGVAPAILMYMWVLESFGSIGWVSSFLFVACGALRLARFNVQTNVIDPRRFNGLPIPAAAAMMATTVLFFYSLGLQPANYRIGLLLLNTIMAVFMVSSIKFHSFKDLTIVRRKPFSSTVSFVLLLALIAIAPFIIPFLLCAGYVISGPIMTLYQYKNNRKKQPESMNPKSNESPQPNSTDGETQGQKGTEAV